MDQSIVDLGTVSSQAIAAFEQAGRPEGAWPLLPLLARHMPTPTVEPDEPTVQPV